MTKKDLDVTEGVDSISRAIKSFNDSFDSEHSAEEPARRRRSRPLNERQQNVPSPKEPRQRPKRQPTKISNPKQWGATDGNSEHANSSGDGRAARRPSLPVEKTAWPSSRLKTGTHGRSVDRPSREAWFAQVDQRKMRIACDGNQHAT